MALFLEFKKHPLKSLGIIIEEIKRNWVRGHPGGVGVMLAYASRKGIACWGFFPIEMIGLFKWAPLDQAS